MAGFISSIPKGLNTMDVSAIEKAAGSPTALSVPADLV
jgi:hypothetical protein